MAESDTILQLGIEAAREGNREEARNLFGLLTRQEPDHVQAWLWLAGVAEGPDERRAALERVLELDPTNEMAVKGIQAMGGTPEEIRQPAPIATAPPPAVALSDEERYAAELDSAFDDYDALPKAAPLPRPESALAEDELSFETRRSTEPIRTRRPTRRIEEDDVLVPAGGPSRLLWLLLGLIAIVVIAFLGFQLLGGRNSQTAQTGTIGPELTATGDIAPTMDGGGNGAIPTDTLSGTGALSGTIPLTPTTSLTETFPLTPIAGVFPSDAALSAANPAPIALGTELQANGWTYTFPDICGASCGTVAGNKIGGFDTQGSYVVVLVMVANNTGTSQPLPADFFVLKDQQGRIYRALPQVSSAYVQPGINADIGMETAVPANGGFTSIPLLFDVQHGATNLSLFSSAKIDQGWLVLSAVP